MKKFLFAAALLGMLFSSLSQLKAEPYGGTDWCCYDEWSLGDGKFTVGAEWLYWKTMEDNLSAAYISQVSLTSPFARNHVLHPHFEYQSGFRVGVGYELPGDCWDAAVYYTNIPSRAKRSASANLAAGETIFLLRNGIGLIEDPTLFLFPLADLHAKWHFNLSYLDIDIARTICFGECFNLRPHIGARIAWMDQKFHANADLAFGAGTDARLRAHFKERFNGYGIEGGLWGDWNVGYGVSVVGHFGGSVLYSKFRNRLTAHFPEPALGVCTKDNFWSSIPTVDYFIGIQYAGCMCDTVIAARIGWEQHVFFDFNRFHRCGNLTTQGLTLGLAASF